MNGPNPIRSPGAIEGINGGKTTGSRVSIVAVALLFGMIFSELLRSAVPAFTATYCAYVQMGIISWMVFYGTSLLLSRMTIHVRRRIWVIATSALVVGAIPLVYRLGLRWGQMLDISFMRFLGVALLLLPYAAVTGFMSFERGRVNTKKQRSTIFISMVYVMAYQVILVPLTLGEPIRSHLSDTVALKQGSIYANGTGGSFVVHSVPNGTVATRFGGRSTPAVDTPLAIRGVLGARLLGGSVGAECAILAVARTKSEDEMSVAFVHITADNYRAHGTSRVKSTESIPNYGRNIVSPDGSKVVFNDGAVYEVGSFTEVVPSRFENMSLVHFVAWTRDSRKCIFYSDDNTLLVLSGEEPTHASYKLAYFPTHRLGMALSPDEQTISYVAGPTEKPTLIVQALDNLHCERFEMGNTMRIGPVPVMYWLDGSSLVYMTHRGGLYEITPDTQRGKLNVTRLSQILETVVWSSMAGDSTLFWTTYVDDNITGVHSLRISK